MTATDLPLNLPAEARRLVESIDLDALVREAMQAETKATGRCGHCRKNVTVMVPDTAAKTRMLELLFQHGYGRPGSSAAPVIPEDATVAQLRHMSDAELVALAGGEVNHGRDRG